MKPHAKSIDSSSTGAEVLCPICRGDTSRRFEKQGYWIRMCSACRFRFLESLPTRHQISQIYGDDYFFGGGAGYPNYLSEGELIRTHGRRYAKLLEPYTKSGRLLDVGAAGGFLLSGFFDHRWQGDGLEPNGTMAHYAQSMLGVNVVQGALETLPPTLQGREYDLITMVQVVPHFYDIRAAFRSAASITRDKGFWLIETWNADSLLARFFGRQWHEYSPPSVLRWFTPANLATLCVDFGFTRVASGRPKKRIQGSHIKSLLNYKLTNFPLKMGKPFLRMIPDRLTLPYPSEDLFWLLLQKTGKSEDSLGDANGFR